MGRAPLPPIPHEPPTDAERRLGSVVACAGCAQTWPLRLRDARDARLCINCGREARRGQRAAHRLKQRLQDGLGEPRQQPDVAFQPNKTVSVEDVLHGRVPPEVQADLDRVMAAAASVAKKRSR